MTKEEYNAEPVLYCERCLSLRVLGVADSDMDYCDNCGSADIKETSIEDWENLYEARYGKKYINIK